MKMCGSLINYYQVPALDRGGLLLLCWHVALAFIWGDAHFLEHPSVAVECDLIHRIEILLALKNSLRCDRVPIEGIWTGIVRFTGSSLGRVMQLPWY